MIFSLCPDYKTPRIKVIDYYIRNTYFVTKFTSNYNKSKINIKLT
jgi:hypothetical protein